MKIQNWNCEKRMQIIKEEQVARGQDVRRTKRWRWKDRISDQKYPEDWFCLWCPKNDHLSKPKPLPDWEAWSELIPPALDCLSPHHRILMTCENYLQGKLPTAPAVVLYTYISDQARHRSTLVYYHHRVEEIAQTQDNALSWGRARM